MSSVKGDRAHKVIEDVGRTTEAVTQKLWFLDLKFSEFATPRLIGFVFLLYLILCGLSFVAFVGYTLLTLPVLFAAAAIVADLILTLISAVLVRVFLEAFLVVFRIAESLTQLRYLKSIAEKQ